MTTSKTKISTDNAPAALGPYSQAIAINRTEKMVFVSGQLPIDPSSGTLIKGDIAALTKQVIKNIQEILHAAGSDLHLVIRTDVFLADLKDFKEMNEEYARHFSGETPPARQTIQVAGLPLGSPIEISCIALVVP